MRLKAWRAGEPVDHRALNETNRAVESMTSGAAFTRPGGSMARDTAAMFRVVAIAGDYVTAYEFDGTTAGSRLYYIAKPYLLRRTAFDGAARNGITYTYTSDTARTADNGTSTESQVVVPSYVANDVIFAIRPVRGTGVTYAPIDNATAAVDWLDLNVDGRAWAKESS